MGTFIKYLIYIALILAVYFIVQGLWQENQAESTLSPEVEEIIINQSDNVKPEGKATQNP